MPLFLLVYLIVFSWSLTSCPSFPWLSNNSGFHFAILNRACLLCFNVGGLTLRASRMFTSLIMKLEPCGAHTPGLHWSPNSIAPLINAQMMLADPLPFLFHILSSAAPSVSAVLVLFSELCSSTLSLLHHCVRPSVHCAYANNTWPIPARWYWWFILKRGPHVCYQQLLQL